MSLGSPWGWGCPAGTPPPQAAAPRGRLWGEEVVLQEDPFGLKTRRCARLQGCVGGPGAGAGGRPRWWWVWWCGEPREQPALHGRPDQALSSPNPAALRRRSQGETALGPRLPSLSLTPLGEPGNGAGLAGPRSAAGPCLLRLPDTLSPRPLRPLPENPRNLAAPEGIQLLWRRAARSPTPPAAP